MRFAIFKGEKNVTDLASRLFHIQGRGAQAATKRAADALLQANPQLKELSNISVGSLIAIPDAAPPIVPGEDAAGAALVRSFAAQNILTSFEFLQQRLTEIEVSALDQVKSGNASFQTSEMRAALKAVTDANLVFPAEMPSLDGIAKDTKEILKNVQAAQTARKEALTPLRTTVASFAK